jgi:hypothetical protein
MRATAKALFTFAFLALALLTPCQGYEDIPDNLKSVCLYAPDPAYPQAVVRTGRGGKGLFRLTIDPKTGCVTEVKVLKHLSLVLLDEFSAKAFLQWRFKPGTITSVTIPIEFHAWGYTHVYH